MTTPRPEQKSWAAYYQHIKSLPELHRHLTNIMPFIEHCRAAAHGPRLLEIGTGSGLQAVYLSQLGYNVTGLDLDPGIVAQNTAMNRAFNGKANFLVADMFSLPFSTLRFDLCYHQGLMEHFDPPEIQSALHEQLRVANHVLFTVPTSRWNGGLFGDERLWDGAYWRHVLTPFRIIDVFGYSYQGLPSRALNLIGRRITHHRPRSLYHLLARHKAGQIGFLIANHPAP